MHPRGAMAKVGGVIAIPIDERPLRQGVRVKEFVLAVIVLTSSTCAVFTARAQQSSVVSSVVECAPELSTEQCKAAQIDAMLKKLDQAAALTASSETRAVRARNQLAYSYASAIQKAVTKNWLQPDGVPNATCEVHVIQLPGGMVESATVDPSCPYNEVGRRSVVDAVLRTETLPYKGFESIFQRNITFTFVPWSKNGVHTP